MCLSVCISTISNWYTTIICISLTQLKTRHLIPRCFVGRMIAVLGFLPRWFCPRLSPPSFSSAFRCSARTIASEIHVFAATSRSVSWDRPYVSALIWWFPPSACSRPSPFRSQRNLSCRCSSWSCSSSGRLPWHIRISSVSAFSLAWSKAS